MSLLRTELQPEAETPPQIQVIRETQYNNIVQSLPRMARSPSSSKDIHEVFELIREVIVDYQDRQEIAEEAKIRVVLSQTDVDAEIESVSLELLSRLPGSFEKGPPTEIGKIRNYRPVLREEIDDPDAPGYRQAILGYFYDNTIEVTPWARNMKTVLERASWLETIMDEYAFYFAMAGVNRILFLGRDKTVHLNASGNIIHGCPLKFFVRTEKIRAVREKALEQIIIRASVRNTLE